MELLLMIFGMSISVVVLVVMFYVVLESTKIIDERDKHGRYDHRD